MSKMMYVVLLLALRLALDISYTRIISIHFAYDGFTCEPDLVKLIESYMMTLVLGTMLPNSLRRSSDYLITVLFMLIIVPSLSLYGLQGKSRAYTYMIAICFLIIVVVRRFRLKVAGPVRGGPALGSVICISIIILSLLERLAVGRLQYFNLNLREVYTYRTMITAMSTSRVFDYVHNWAQKVANPALLAWSLQTNHRQALIVLSGIQLLFFGTSGVRASLFYPLMVIAVFWVSRRRYALYLTGLGLLLLVVISSVMASYLGYMLPVSLFVRRLMFVSARATHAYYEFFSRAGHVYMSNSVLSAFLTYAFSEPPQRLISDYLYGHTLTWVNTGFLGAGYMHFGFLGMIVYSVIIGLLMGVADGISVDRVPVPFAVAMMIAPSLTLLMSADLPTALLTHGVALSIILLWLFAVPREAEERDG